MPTLRERLSDRIVRDRRRLAGGILPTEGGWFDPAPRLHQQHVDGCVVLADRETMIRGHLPKEGLVAEIGSLYGDNARTILEGTRPRELHLVDRDFSVLRRETVASGLDSGVVKLHENDSATALASFPDEYFDWIYIDGDHSYEGVKRDIDQAVRKVKRDGLLVFNDYIAFSHNELMGYGIVRAVNELCVDDGWAFRYFAFELNMYCDVAIGRR